MKSSTIISIIVGQVCPTDMSFCLPCKGCGTLVPEGFLFYPSPPPLSLKGRENLIKPIQLFMHSSLQLNCPCTPYPSHLYCTYRLFGFLTLAPQYRCNLLINPSRILFRQVPQAETAVRNREHRASKHNQCQNRIFSRLYNAHPLNAWAVQNPCRFQYL